MAVVLPVKGSLNWDLSLNTALTYLDNNNTTTVTNALQRVNNLSDLTNVIAARSNLGISSGVVAGVNNFNVKDYGALGNGVADDTSSIQAALNAAVGGGTVFFPPGNYLLNSVPLTVTNVAVVMQGAGSENSKLIIGASFVGTAVISVTAFNFQFCDLSLSGASGTTTSNPVANGIEITGVRRAKIQRCLFGNINGWAIEGASTNANGTSNFFGSLISDNYFSSCAGGIHTLGNTTQAFAVNVQISNNQMYTMGVTTGASANLDAIRIEDSWDVLISNNICWMSVGTGSALHIKGTCASTFVKNIDALGPTTGNNILIEDSANGSPQNTQINGGIIQQGLIGLRVTGGATQQRFNTLRFISNQTHGLSIEGTGAVIHVTDVFFSTSGAGATGTNYDINWSGSSNGYINGCRFDSPIVTSGNAGVQQTINFPASAPVRVFNCAFGGTGSTSANWFTNIPLGVLEGTNGQFNFATNIRFTNATTALSAVGTISLQPATAGQTTISSNVLSTDAFDRFRLMGDGSMAWGSGTAARDAFMGRATAQEMYISPNLIVGAQTSLGDNGVGELQLANATTVPTTNPTGGSLVYSQSGIIKNRNPQGLVTTESGVVQSTIATTTINTTGLQAIETFTVPANDPVAGAVYEMTGYGVFTTNATATTVAFGSYWGATGLTTVGTAPTITASLTNAPFYFKSIINFRSTTSAVAYLELHLATSATTGAYNTYLISSSAPVAVTTTSATAFAVQVNFNNAQSMSLLGGDVRRMA